MTKISSLIIRTKGKAREIFLNDKSFIRISPGKIELKEVDGFEVVRGDWESVSPFEGKVTADIDGYFVKGKE